MVNVTKKDIIEMISNATGLTQIDTRIVLESFLENISKFLREGKNIEIRGFGRFKIKERKARVARNPLTNEAVQVPAGYKLVFQASREMRHRINNADWKNTIAIQQSALPGAL
jgi:DNA-binding protein HU-beta/integration host factor subunit beta